MSEHLANAPGLSALAEGNVQSALATLRELAWRDPSYKTYCNLAVAERAAGHLFSARDHLLKAVTFSPRSPVAYFNLANLESDLGNFSQSLSLYDKAFSLDPSNTRIALGYAQCLLREREFSRAWPLWEMGRINYSWHVFPVAPPWHPSFKPGRVLVVCEGGYGDAFLFSRWLPFVKASGATKVTLMIWDCLKDWTDWTKLGVDRVISKDADLQLEYDYSTSWMSLPALSGMRSMGDVPWPNAWTQMCYRPLPPRNKTPRIGFCWTAAQLGDMRKTKMLDDLSARDIACNLQSRGRLESLVPGASPGAKGYKVYCYTLAPDATWTDTTALVQCCDYVVTADTAVAHLSALCGVPTLILLPCHSGWQWFRDTLVDEWYGPHVRYFRNRDPFKWDVPAILQAIEEFLPSTTAP